MSYTYRGHCSCTAVRISLQLHKPLPTFTPRRCDCDYCEANDGVYLSHPRGTFSLGPASSLLTEKQGDGIASMQKCQYCGDLVAVTCDMDGRLCGTIRASILVGAAQLPPAETVSPKYLPAAKRWARWRSVWMTADLQP